MASQDGITVRQMRLKVLYTFDSESKTVCLARWPHLLDIQTAYLDEVSQIGVIELKTCIQAIVSASPELVARLGNDYTIYAYDYSEYETPLVGQGMLSWILAAASTTPDAPAHQSKTIVTGKVCKNVGPFSRGAQETLEVRLKLVPVPTSLQNEYNSNMQKYRENQNALCTGQDIERWASFVQNDQLSIPQSLPPVKSASSPIDRSGIEHFQTLLTECATPRDLGSMSQVSETFRAGSPALSISNTRGRAASPAVTRPSSRQQLHQQQQQQPPKTRRDRSCSNSRSNPPHAIPPKPFTGRRGSTSGYDSSDEAPEAPAPKRAKLMRPERPNMNIEKQPSSLLKAASNAASVRIHRPRPVKPGMDGQVITTTGDEQVRPPTPVPKGPIPPQRLARSRANLRRQSSLAQSAISLVEDAASSSEDCRDNTRPETPTNIPSSPPVFNDMDLQTSSPGLPPLPDHDSGFMSGSMDPIMSDDCNNMGHNEQPTRTQSEAAQPQQRNYVPTTTPTTTTYHAATSIAPTSDAVEAPSMPPRQQSCQPFFTQLQPQPQPQPQPQQQLPQLQPRPPASHTGDVSRPSSRASFRHRPIAPAPPSGSHPAFLTTDPLASPHLPGATTLPSGPMSDFPVQVPATTLAEANRIKSGARRAKQVKNRLDQSIKEGSMPPYCQNCGAIETPTWRRAWFKIIDGNEAHAKDLENDPGALFWEAVTRDEEGQVTAFKQFKKSLAHEDKNFTQLCLCNPCGLYLYKMEKMRPENMWNKSAQKDRRKKKKTRAPLRPVPDVGAGAGAGNGSGAGTGAGAGAGAGVGTGVDAGSAAGAGTLTRSQSKLPEGSVSPSKQHGSSPGPASSPPVSPHMSGAEEPHQHQKGNASAPGNVSSTTAAAASADVAAIPSVNNTSTEQTASQGHRQEVQPQAAPQSPHPNKRASSEQPPSSAEKKRRLNQEAAIEALKQAIKASPARNMAMNNLNMLKQGEQQSLTPRPVCRNLFPGATAAAAAAANNNGSGNGSSNNNTPKALGDSSANVVRPAADGSANVPGNKTVKTPGKENDLPNINLDHGFDDLFDTGSCAALDLALPTTPTPKRHGHRNVFGHNNGNLNFRTSPIKAFTPSKNVSSSVWKSTPLSGQGPGTDQTLADSPDSSSLLLDMETKHNSCEQDIDFFTQTSSLPTSSLADNTPGAGNDWAANWASLTHNDPTSTMNLFPDDDVLKALMLDGMPDNTTAANAGMSLSHPNLFDDLLAMTSAPVGGEGGKAQPPSTSAFDEGFAGIDDSVLTAILNGSNEGTENAEHAGVEGGEGHGNASADANNGAAQGVSAQ